MTTYVITALLGLLVMILAFWGVEEEMNRRQNRYKRLFHTKFVALDSGKSVELSCVHYVMGRRKRRCDLCLEHLNDPSISRVHAVMWHDGVHFCIAPAYNFRFFGGSKYPEVLVNGRQVPPVGIAIEYGDIIQMGHSQFTLRNSQRGY